MPSRNPMARARLARTTGESVMAVKRVVGRADGDPVGLLPGRRRGVHRGDDGLGQVGAGRSRGHPQPLQPACDAAAVPAGTVLFVERHQRAGRVDARRPPRIMQQHKCCQRVGFRLGRHQGAQFAGQSHALVAQFVADRRRTRRGPVALGEHRVDAREHVRRALREQLGRRHAQRNVRAANLLLGAGDALTHRGLALQQCAGDLGDRQTRNQPQRERQLRGALQRGVRAGEHHPQLVIADRVRVGAVGARPDVIEHSGQFLSGTD